MFKISCDICMDLIPLAKDQVASDDSHKAVTEHLETCSSCAGIFQTESALVRKMDDDRVVEKIKNKLYLGALVIAILGALVGLALTEGAGLFYNILIMPTIGLIGYFALKKKWYYVPLSLFALSSVWLLTTYLSQGILSDGHSTLLSTLLLSTNWALIYSGLAVLGAMIGFLLKIAFDKTCGIKSSEE